MEKTIFFLLFCKSLCEGYKDPRPPCGQNEEYKCVLSCPPQRTCVLKNALFKCAYDEKEVCQSKCVCKENYFRNAIGECISSKDCDNCRIHQHEFYSTCGGVCDTFCSSLDVRNRTNCGVEDIQCNEQCYCEDGYARDEDNNCIPAAKCNDLCKGPHEYYSQCSSTCPPDLCVSILAFYDCSKRPPCQPGCVCQESFLRESVGTPCIPTRKCSQLANAPDLNKYKQS